MDTGSNAFNRGIKKFSGIMPCRMQDGNCSKALRIRSNV